MWNTTPTLWVEPRLRGFVVVPDARNPSTRVGEFIPYEAGWGALRDRLGDVPRACGVEPLKSARLRVRTTGQMALARRAMERDLRRRVREGLVCHTIRQPGPWMRWAPLAVSAALIAAVGLASWVNVNVLPYIAPALMTFPVALMLRMFSRTTLRSFAVEGGEIVVVTLTGDSRAHPLRDVESVRGSSPFLVRIRPGVELAVQTNDAAARRLLGALKLRMTRREADKFLRDLVARSRRVVAIGLLLVAAAVTYTRWSLGIGNGVQITNWPLVSAAVNALIGVAALGATFELILQSGPSVRWIQNQVWRRERRIQRRERAVRPVLVQ